jgi:uncharacterized protein (UPF0248 family)
MRTSHRVMLKLRHDPKYAFEKVTVWYINRGAPNDTSAIEGSNIRLLDRDYMEIETDTGVSYIPYHRILRICYGPHIAWDRDLGDLTE